MLVSTALISIVVAACSGDNGDPASSSWDRTDSAGVEIIYTDFPPASAPIHERVAGPAVVEIGEAFDGDPAAQFETVMAVLPLGDTAVAVINRGAESNVRIFDIEGRHIRSIGRTGEGPGEYRQPVPGPLLPGDTVAILDITQSRLVLLPVDGGTPRSIRIQGEGPMPAFPLGAGQDGRSERVLIRTDMFDRAPQGWSEDSVKVAAVDLTNGELIPLGSFHEERRFMAGNSINTLGYGSRGVLVPHDEWLGWLETGPGEIRFYDQTGDLRRIIRFTTPREPVTAAQRDTLIARQTRSWDRMVASNPGLADRLQPPTALEFAEFLPRVISVTRVPGGYLVGDGRSEPGVNDRVTLTPWFDEDWKPLGFIRSDLDMGRITGVGDELIWLRNSDDLGITTVSAWRFPGAAVEGR